ncbi:helix-turn-helix domain-containing protein [Inquilinus limosus]|nr:helix-turn-helix domain-containing protein [Inquilinus limosus]
MADIVRSKPDGSFVLVHDDGSETPYTPAPTDWAAIDAMTDEDIAARIAADPDAAPDLTLPQVRRVFMISHRVAAPGFRIKALRRSLGLSQSEFARRYGLPLATVRNWEQRRRVPDEAGMALLKVIAADPEGTRRLLEATG